MAHGTVVVSSQRQVNTYAHMWHTSKVLLDVGLADPSGSSHLFRASLVFTAFTLEACLNHLGPSLFDCWDEIESLSPRAKLSLLTERLEVPVDYGRRPWQVMTELFRFRNEVAHGKSDLVSARVTVPVDTPDKTKRILPTKWERYGTKTNAIRAREDVESIIRTLYAAGSFPDDAPFWHGSQYSTTGDI